MVSLLLSNGANPKLLTDGANPNSIGRANFSILCEVIFQDGDERYKPIDALEELRMFGDSTDKSRHERYIEIMKTLLHAGALPNFEVDRGGALWLAARYCDLDMARILLQNSADRNAKTRDGQTPLDMAKKMNCKEIEELLTK
jgi:ankyrin repeat protein